VAIEQTPDGALGHLQPMCFIQLLGAFRQGDVRRLLDQRQNFLSMGFDPVRAVIPALWPVRRH